MAKKETKKKSTQVALAPVVKGLIKYGGVFGTGVAVDKLRRMLSEDDEDEKVSR